MYFLEIANLLFLLYLDLERRKACVITDNMCRSRTWGQITYVQFQVFGNARENNSFIAIDIGCYVFKTIKWTKGKQKALEIEKSRDQVYQTLNGFRTFVSFGNLTANEMNTHQRANENILERVNNLENNNWQCM